MKFLKKYLLLIPALFILSMCTPLNSYAQVDNYDYVTCRNVPFTIRKSSVAELTYTFSIPNGPNVDAQLIQSFSPDDGESFGFYHKIYRITIDEPGEYTLVCKSSGIGSGSGIGSDSIEYSVKVAVHDFSSEWTVDTEPTCTVDGSRSHRCIYCNSKASSEILPATGHASDGWKVITPASCSKTGKKAVVCSKCNETLATETLPTTAHTFSSWKTTKNATIFKSGQKKRTCVVCSKAESKKIAKLKATVKLKKSKITLKAGNSCSLKLKSKTKGDSVSSWISSNKKIVTVNRKNGTVKGVSKGTAYITLKMKSGCTTKCKIIVK